MPSAPGAIPEYLLLSSPAPLMKDGASRWVDHQDPRGVQRGAEELAIRAQSDPGVLVILLAGAVDEGKAPATGSIIRTLAIRAQSDPAVIAVPLACTVDEGDGLRQGAYLGRHALQDDTGPALPDCVGRPTYCLVR